MDDILFPTLDHYEWGMRSLGRETRIRSLSKLPSSLKLSAYLHQELQQLKILRNFHRQGVHLSQVQQIIEIALQSLENWGRSKQIWIFLQSPLHPYLELVGVYPSGATTRTEVRIPRAQHLIARFWQPSTEIPSPQLLSNSSLIAEILPPGFEKHCDWVIAAIPGPVNFLTKMIQLLGIVVVGYAPPFSGNELAITGLFTNNLGWLLCHHEFNEKAATDTLSHVYTRGYFFHYLDCQMMKLGLPLSLGLLDIDHFKSINDTYTHLAGDCILQQVGTLLREIMRPSEVVGKYGGEEFIILMPCAYHDACARAEIIRHAFAQHPFILQHPHLQQTICLTVSIGVSSWNQQENLGAWLERTDRALYQAKNQGRNCVVGMCEI